MRVLAAVFCAVGFLISCPQARAWNKPGHMVSAAIAYADLKARNPDALAKAVALLKQHPDFETRWSTRLAQVAEEDRDLYLFMLAARWPDDIRGDDDYDQPNAHYVNIPYRPGEVGMVIPQGDSIMTVFPEKRAIAASDDDAEWRAVALCWVFHLTGDVHQPLHTTKLVTANFPEPEGDRGGTRFYIRVKPNSSTISLHTFWDGAVLGSEKFQSVRNRATELRNDAALSRMSLAAELQNVGFENWAAESYAAAVAHAYLDGALHGGTHSDNGVVLPPGYKDAAVSVARRRMALAGYRLSDELAQIFGD